ncbi:MAG: Translation initiation factor 3 [candidate division WS6 bacterium 34_10]|uniref:Translation initiation factor IF-3 n=1 Tax=candidate division WS6 bacterium 34_10 TaxID=1641389 RepID=A0A117LZC6_9BACT|nr:MAG: Translation initiation factor 3 [candidate division WS6 bacterium 34_10]
MAYNRYKKKESGPKKNERIRAKEVMVVDDDEGKIGVMKTEDAIAKAKEQGLDLVEVAPKAQPPVCKIMDYSKYIYRQKKKARKNRKKSKQKDMKEFKFSPVIDVGDINTRVRRATEYLEKGHPVRITMYRRGRQSREQAEKVFNEILTNFDEYSSIEPTPKKEGRNMYITFFKKNG